MRFGFQISISGGFSRVVARATHLGCETIQIFSGNPRGWKNKPLSSAETAKFKEGVKKEKINPVFVHMPYLPNIASPRENLYFKSIKSLQEDLVRTEKLGATYLVLHLGSRINDSKTPLSSRIDRHWHIGDGYIGREGFRRIINHPELSHLPVILETPRKSDEDDLKNMSVVRDLVEPALSN